MEIFDIYKSLRKDINDGVDLVGLEAKTVNLRNNQFLIAVAGEVKAGKSTFINSLIRGNPSYRCFTSNKYTS